MLPIPVLTPNTKGSTRRSTVGGKTIHTKIWMTCLPRPPVALWEALVSQLGNQYYLSYRLSGSKMGWLQPPVERCPGRDDQVWEALWHHLQDRSSSFQCTSGFLSAHACGFKHFKKFSSWYHCPSSEWQIYFTPCTRSCGLVAQRAGWGVLHSYLWVLQSRVTVNRRVYFWTYHSLPYVRHGWHLHFFPHSGILGFSVSAPIWSS